MNAKLSKKMRVFSLRLVIVLFLILVLSCVLSANRNIYTYEDKYKSEKNIPTSGISIYESINSREESSLKSEVSDYKIKYCTSAKHTDKEILQVCVADFQGSTSGFYDSSKELLVISSFSNSLLVHELFHASSLHFIKKGLKDFESHESQEKMAYNAEFLYEQIIAFKGDIITQETSKKLVAMYKINK